MLPGEDGLSLCRRLRTEFDIPIIMLTAKGDEFDRVIGLEMGADDYLPKPFGSRLHSVMRSSRCRQPIPNRSGKVTRTTSGMRARSRKLPNARRRGAFR